MWPADTYGMSSWAEYLPLCWTPHWAQINDGCGSDPSFCSRDKCCARDPTLCSVVSGLVSDAKDSPNLSCKTVCDAASVKRSEIGRILLKSKALQAIIAM